MKWNSSPFSIKIYPVKYAWFTSLQSWAFCLPKMVRGMGRVNPKIPRRDVPLAPNSCLHNQSFLTTKNVERLRNERFIRMIQQHWGRRNWYYTANLRLTKTNLWPELTLATIQDANDIEEGESDEYRFTAATLEARYERETPVNLRLVNSSLILDFYAVIPGFTHFKIAKTNLSHQITHHTILYWYHKLLYKSRLLLDVRK